MPITISGSGTITGLTTGGLPDGSIAAADIAAGVIPAAFSLSNAEDGTGTDFEFNSGYGSNATAYGVRAWVNFDGTSGSIGSGRASANVTSISDHGTGDYSLNFTNSMPDTNYCLLGTSSGNANHNSQALSINYTTAPTTSAVRIFTAVPGSSTTVGFKLDTAYNCVAIVR